MIEKTPVCPKCGSTDHYKSGFTKEKQQRYQCKSCGHSFIQFKDRIRQLSGHACPRCESLNVIWHGWTLLTGGRKRHRLRCKDCGHTFYNTKTNTVEEVEN